MPVTSARRARRRGRWAVLAVALLAGAVGALGPSVPAPADAANCDLGTPTTDSSFINSVAPAEKPALRLFEDALRATGAYYLCGNFLVPPSTLPAGGPGTVIRVRPIYPSPAGQESVAMRVMYKTTMRDGTVVPATTVVVLPRAAATGPRDSVVWAHPTVGINRTCRALLDHVTMYAGSNLVNADIPTLGLPNGILDPFVHDDRVIVLPDYIGIGAQINDPNPGAVLPYLARETTGRTIIDAQRAATNLSSVTAASGDWALFGYSQGGHAAAATAEVYPAYADGTGVDLKGVVAVAGPGDVPDFFERVNDPASPLSQGDRAFVAMAMVGIVADRWTVNTNGTGGIISASTYLTAPASYATTTYLRNANPYISPWPWEASMTNAGQPWGSIDLSPPLLIGNNPVQATPWAWWYDLNYRKYATAVYPDPQGPAIGPHDQPLGPYGSYSIPAAEQVVSSCLGHIVGGVYERLPVGTILKTTLTTAQQTRLQEVLQANSLGYVATDVPTVLIVGEDDALAPPTPVGETPETGEAGIWFDRMCGLGDPVRQVAVADADHGEVLGESYGDIKDWLDDALGTSPPPDFPGSTGC